MHVLHSGDGALTGRWISLGCPAQGGCRDPARLADTGQGLLNGLRQLRQSPAFRRVPHQERILESVGCILHPIRLIGLTGRLRASGSPIQRLDGQLVGGRSLKGRRQGVCLIDDHRSVLTDDPLLHGVQRKQCVIGDDDVRGASVRDRAFSPAVFHEGTA